MTVIARDGIDAEDVPLHDHVEVLRSAEVGFACRSEQRQRWPVAVGVDASTWVSAVHVVAVHQRSEWVEKSGLSVSVEAVELDPDVPEPIFGGTQRAVVELDQNTSAPSCSVVALSPPWGSKLAVFLEPNQGPGEPTETQTCTLSVWPVGRRQSVNRD